MSRLGSQLTDSNAESQSEARISDRVQNLIQAASNRKSLVSSGDIGVPDTYETQSERYAQDEDAGNMSEAISDTNWGDPQAVVGGTAYSSGYNISVETLSSGYILRVGCQSIAVESGADVGKLIGMYLTDKTLEKRWMSSDKIIQKFLQEDLQVK